MTGSLTDIDIDFPDREKALEELIHVSASMIQNSELKRHNVGVYFQQIPVDPVTNLSAIEYQEAEARGYFKIDFLNLTIYNEVRDEAHLLELMEREPDWEMLEYKEIVDGLFHLGNHFDVVNRMKPRSVEQLAMVLALIRPAKRHLVGRSWEEVEKEIWVIPEGESYYFKKAHSLSYAMVVIVQMNLMMEKITSLSTESDGA